MGQQPADTAPRQALRFRDSLVVPCRLRQRSRWPSWSRWPSSSVARFPRSATD